MPISSANLGKIAPYLKEPKLSIFAGAISAAMLQFDITTPEQQAAFIAQIMHESAECRYTAEIASGKAYEFRKDLGNTTAGDGVRYKGRGLIQITGRTNYKQVSDALGIDFIAHPELLEQPDYAALSAAWFWSSRGLNRFCDGTDAGFLTITKRINGGTNGLEMRRAYWAKAKTVLGIK